MRDALGNHVARKPALVGALIADDATGACDAGAQFASRGLRTRFVLNLREALSGEAEMICVSTESRSSSSAASAQSVALAADLLNSLEPSFAMKKIDSGLRGNIMAEVQSAMRSFAATAAILTPSFPALGRTVSNGWLRFSGAAEPPVHIPTLLNQQSAQALASIPRCGDPAELGAAIEQCMRDGQRILVADAECDADLRRLVEAASSLEERFLWVGSAGLAGALAERFAGRRRESQPGPGPRPPRGRVVVFVGSTHAATISQRDYLVENRALEPIYPSRPEPSRGRAFGDESGHLVVCLEWGRSTDEEVRLFFQSLDRAQLRGIILTGGDTAALVFRALETTAVGLRDEIAPGIPWGIIEGGLADGLPLATKSGGFGGPSSLDDAVEFLSAVRGVDL
jgi:uncharacterized protein YgbK (DUF1537 family)